MVYGRAYQHCQRLVRSLLGPSRAILRIHRRRYCVLSHPPVNQRLVYQGESESGGLFSRSKVFHSWISWCRRIMTYLKFKLDHEVGGTQRHPVPQPPTLRWLVLRQSYMSVRVLPSVIDSHRLPCSKGPLSNRYSVPLTMIVVPPKSHHLFCRSLST